MKTWIYAVWSAHRLSFSQAVGNGDALQLHRDFEYGLCHGHYVVLFRRGVRRHLDYSAHRMVIEPYIDF